MYFPSVVFPIFFKKFLLIFFKSKIYQALKNFTTSAVKLFYLFLRCPYSNNSLIDSPNKYSGFFRPKLSNIVAPISPNDALSSK